MKKKREGTSISLRMHFKPIWSPFSIFYNRLDTQIPESAQCSEKQQSPCEGEGGLKFEEKNCWKTFFKSTPKKQLGIGSPVFCIFFIHPNPITAAKGQGEGAQLLLISFATRLHGVCLFRDIGPSCLGPSFFGPSTELTWAELVSGRVVLHPWIDAPPPSTHTHGCRANSYFVFARPSSEQKLKFISSSGIQITKKYVSFWHWNNHSVIYNDPDIMQGYK